MPNAVDRYLARLPQPHRRTLTSMRATLRRLLPHAEECLAYGMPCLKVAGKGVVCYAAFTTHCSWFPLSARVLNGMARDLARYPQSKGGLRFDPARGLPLVLVRKLVRARLAELSQPPASGKGRALSFHSNGAVRTKGGWRAHRRHGRWEFFRPDGSLQRSGSFRDGRRVGAWRTFARRRDDAP